jgi:predicted amidohydrolase YtcJ
MDLILWGGTFLTQNSGCPTAEALGIRAGRIAAVGKESDVLPLAGPATKTVDLGGRTVVPGFNDAHAHIWKIGQLLMGMVDLRRIDGIAALSTAVREAAARLPPDRWLLGRGWNEANLTEGRGPSRADLDRAVPGRPVVLTRTCGHIYACNTRALEAAGIGPSTDNPPGGEIDRGSDGLPTGIVRETAMGLIIRAMPAPTRDDYAAMITAAVGHQQARGITSTTDAGVSPPLLEAYRRLDAEGTLPGRVNVMASRVVDGVGVVPLPTKHRSDLLTIDTVKFLADGGLSGATAALSVPYRGRDTRGVLRFEFGELLELARQAHRDGWRIAIHAIGDVTIDQVTRIYEQLGPGPVRHRVEHLGLPRLDACARLAALGTVAVPQTVFLYELGRNFRAALPEPFLSDAYPIRRMLDHGLTVALSSDAPVVEDDSPLRGIQAAVDRRDDTGVAVASEQAITAAEALYAYTMGGAIASGDEANRGSLTVGKWADLAVLSANPLTCPTESIAPIAVDQTYLAGHLVYQR